MIDSTHITDPYIFCLDNTLAKEQCNKIINKFDADSNVAQGVTADGIDLNVKNSKDLPISSEKNWKEEDALFFNIINNSVEKYYQHLNSIHNLQFFTTGNTYYYKPFGPYITDTGYQIQKTDPGKGYIWHNDFTYDHEKARELTYILYLNDVDEGWTQFYNGDQISPRAGRVVIFPATWTYVHQGYPPIQTKYLMTGWIHCKWKPNDET